MNEFFDNLNGFIALGKTAAAGAATKAAETLTSWAAYLNSLAAGLSFASNAAPTEEQIAECASKLQGLCPAKGAKMAAGAFDPTPWVQMFLMILEMIRKWRNPTPVVA